MKTKRFYRQPKTVEAVQFDGTNQAAAEIQAWTRGQVACLKLAPGYRNLARSQQTVALIGDWIVYDGADGFYPVSEEFFRSNFSEVFED